ncbi:MAG: bifunctional demethylmenaquinone methyltransferase/2-methoxy-6-polyprenyl-1,4-benzoquinol methylase UbiE [Acidobacteriota bacterium]
MRKKKTDELFSLIADKYDLLNHILSLNADRRWRKKLAELLSFSKSYKILDVCAGTCDLAITLAKKGPKAKIIGIDISEDMLKIGLRKIDNLNLCQNITLQRSDAFNLPFRDETFDAVTIGFGLRNFLDVKKGIEEMIRVLKKGGVLLILELTLPEQSFLAKVYKFYLKKIVPLIGGLISGSKASYEYLSSSIIGFFDREEIIELLKEEKLKNIYLKNLSSGIACILKGEK